MELRNYFSVLRRRLALIVITVVAAAGIAWISTPQTARYTARATIYVGARQLLTGTNNSGLSNDYLLGVARVTATFAAMIQSLPTAEAAIDRTGLQRSAGAVLAETKAIPETNTQLLFVQVSDRQPTVAQQLANAMASSFVDKVQTFEPSAAPAEGTVPSLPAYIFESAHLPTSPEPTALRRNVLLAALFGFLAAAGLAFLLEYLDVTIKNPADAERRLELPVLGAVPMQQRTAAPPLARSRAEARRA